MGKNKFNKSKFVFCDTLDIEFISFHNEIIDKIIKYLPEFLMKTNFGQRQSKGFGSFYINDLNEYLYNNNNKKKYEKDEIEELSKLRYSFEVETTSNDKIIKNKDEIYMSSMHYLKKLMNFMYH